MTERSNRSLLLLALGGAAALLIYLLQFVLAPAPRPDAGIPGETAAAPASSEPRRTDLDRVSVDQQSSPSPSAANVAAQAKSPSPTKPIEQGSTGSHHIRGRILDERTDEAVPELTVTLTRGGRSEIVSTATDGSFQSRTEIGSGLLSFDVADLGARIHHVDVDLGPAIDADLGVLHVKIGPTIPLLVEPDTSKACTARLVESARPSGLAGVIDVRADELDARRMLQGTGDREWSWVTVRPGDVPWIRYSTIPAWEPDGRRKPRVEVRMCGSGAEGWAPVSSTIGIQPPVKVRPTTQYASVSGTLSTSPEFPYSRTSHVDDPGAAVLLLPVKEDVATPIWHEVRPDSKGGFSFSRVKPGPWRLVAHATNCEVVTSDVHIPAGPTELPPIRMKASEKEALFDLGLPRSRDGTSNPRTLVRLRLAAAESFGRAWTAIDDMKLWSLPNAAFDMTEIVLGGSPTFRPFHARVSAPPGELAVGGVDSPDESDFEFDVHDARTQRRLEGLQFSFGPGGSIYGLPNRAPNGAWRLARDAPIRWGVWREGYAPAFGDERSFSQGEGRMTSRCDLKPGWGVNLLFRAGDPSTFESDPWPWRSWTFPNACALVGAIACSPLRNVRVDVEDKTIASSDEEGEAHVGLDTVPDHLTLRCEGWKMLGVQPDDVLSRPRSVIRQYVVWMEPE
jgi:hypothetical protein